jgi:succinyl-diaminopimelate desuccinylase
METEQLKTELVELLRDLVKTPSWVEYDDNGVALRNENSLVAYIEEWLKKNTDFEIERQELAGGRFNLIAKKGNPDIVFLGHTDTVQPSENAKYNQLEAVVNDGKIYGRGTTDMKSGVAAMMMSLKTNKDLNNVWLMLYADEEYYFLGMKGLIEKYGDIRPKLLVSSDGSDLHIGHGCRGLIELRARFTGQTGHPARGTGKSAVMLGYKALIQLEDFVKSFRHERMGESSFNVAYVHGGARVSDTMDQGRITKVGQAGNVVADIMEFVLDIRPASPELSFEMIDQKLKEIAESMSIGYELIESTHRLGAWYTDIDKLEKFTQLASQITSKPAVIDNPGVSGYIDLQMLWEKVGRPTALMFGGGVGDTAHTPDEYIEINDYIKSYRFFSNILIQK